MNEWKLYKSLYDVDGSYVWHVNGESLNHIGYHVMYNNRKFYDWDSDETWWGSDATEGAIEADTALSILADYFGEQPTKEQLDKGQCQCWKFHIDFKNEFLKFSGYEFSSDKIAAWIENHVKQKSLEQELTETLKDLPIAISIEQDHDEYIWAFFDRRGVAATFTEAVGMALEYAMERYLMYLGMVQCELEPK